MTGLIKATDYDIAGIVNYSICRNINITPDTEKEWKMLAYAFRALGIDETSFVECSKIWGTPAREARAAFRYAKRNYYTEEQAATKILYFASQAGIKIWDWLPEEKREQAKAEWRRNAPTPNRHLAEVRRIIEQPTIKPTSESECREYLPSEMILQSEKALNRTTLYKYLFGIFGQSVETSFAAYRVGGSKWKETESGLASAFPLIDHAGNVCDVQLSAFDETGHGMKDPSDPKRKLKSWALARLGKSQNRAKWCFFGEHLLKHRPTARVGIVEAPKTAVIANVVFPQYVWLACMSRNWLNSAIDCQPLKGREIWLFPDREDESLKSWKEIADALNLKGYDVGISDYLDHNPGKLHDDLADIILSRYNSEPNYNASSDVTKRYTPDNRQARMFWEELKRENPLWQYVEKALDIDLDTMKLTTINPN